MKISDFLKYIRLYNLAKYITDRLNTCTYTLRNIFMLRINSYLSHRHITYSHPESRNILVFLNIGGIGNNVEATPLVSAIRSLWPASRITIMAAGNIFDDWCLADEILHEKEELAGRSFDLTFFTYWVDDGGIDWANICRLGKVHRPALSQLDVFIKPEREYILDMIRPYGFYGPVPPLYVSTKELNIELPGNRLIVTIAPCSKDDFKWRHKRWPYFPELSKMLLDHIPDLQLYIVGTKSDDFDDSNLTGRNIIDCRGTLSLAQTACLLKKSNLVIGNDCGPMHIADAVNSRSIIIFGPSCELKNGPLNKSCIITSDVSCRPCQYNQGLIMSCQNPVCMNDISAETVFNKALQLLDLNITDTNSLKDTI